METYEFLFIPFFIDLCVNLWTEWQIKGDIKNPYIKMRWISKPLLLILLIVMYLISAGTNPNGLIICALIFGCLGDIFMMFDYQSKYYLCGSLSFLAGHICYIIVYFSKITITSTFPWWRLLLFLPAVLFFVLIVLPRINKKMPGLENPISTIYGATLLLMGLLTLFRLPSTEINNSSVWMVFFGAQLFILSDGILSLDRFNKKIPYAMVPIMATYALAQFFIVLGLILTV
jgi:uncharacterized membrane protein YhhN